MKLLEIPLTDPEFQEVRLQIMTAGKEVAPIKARELILKIQEAWATHLSQSIPVEEAFLLNSMAADLMRFQKSHEKMLEYYQDKRQKDAIQVKKAQPPEGSVRIEIQDKKFNDDEESF